MVQLPIYTSGWTEAHKILGSAEHRYSRSVRALPDGNQSSFFLYSFQIFLEKLYIIIPNKAHLRCLSQEHNTVVPTRALTEVESTNHKPTMPPKIPYLLISLIITALFFSVDTVALEVLFFSNAFVSTVNSIAVISCQALCVSIILRCSSNKLGDFSRSLKRSCSAFRLGGVTYNIKQNILYSILRLNNIKIAHKTQS